MHGTRPLRLAALLLLTPALSACGSGPPAPGQPLGPAEARTRFAALWDVYEQDLMEGDPATLASWFAEDARLMEPRLETLRGREEIRRYLERTLQAFRVTEVEITPREVAVHGRMTYEMGTAQETVQERTADAESSTWRVRYSAVWMQGSDGRWRIHRLLLSPLEGPPR